jgi:hypothetical protein
MYPIHVFRSSDYRRVIVISWWKINRISENARWQQYKIYKSLMLVPVQTVNQEDYPICSSKLICTYIRRYLSFSMSDREGLVSFRAAFRFACVTTGPLITFSDFCQTKNIGNCICLSKEQRKTPGPMRQNVTGENYSLLACGAVQS